MCSPTGPATPAIRHPTGQQAGDAGALSPRKREQTGVGVRRAVVCFDGDRVLVGVTAVGMVEVAVVELVGCSLRMTAWWLQSGPWPWSCGSCISWSPETPARVIRSSIAVAEVRASHGGISLDRPCRRSRDVEGSPG